MKLLICTASRRAGADTLKTRSGISLEHSYLQAPTLWCPFKNKQASAICIFLQFWCFSKCSLFSLGWHARSASPSIPALQGDYYTSNQGNHTWHTVPYSISDHG